MEEEEKYDAGDPAHVKRKRKSVKLRHSEEIERLRELLSTPGNRAVMWEILSECNVFKDCFSADSLSMARMEGKRYIGLWLIKRIYEADPAAFPLMQVEAEKRGERNK